jgi:hypothetical protein
MFSAFSPKNISPALTGYVPRFLAFLLAALLPLAGGCVSQQKKIVFRPEAAPEQTDAVESGKLIESQRGSPSAPLPEWLNRYLGAPSPGEGLRQAEALTTYRNAYVFVGKNRGTNLNALRQWAAEFTVAQDFPRLAAVRIENRLLAAAALYPDDEYGEFFEALVKNASDAEYPEAKKGESFWVKWRVSVPESAETENPAVRELYELFIIISMDKNALQIRVRDLLANTRTAVPPTRDQAASISRIQQHFFEDF